MMQEDRTARLIAGLKAPCSRTLCELHFVDCEWDLVQATDVADAVHAAGLNIAVLNLSRSQKLKGDTLAGFFAHPLPHLRTLDLAYCQHVDDASIVRGVAVAVAVAWRWRGVAVAWRGSGVARRGELAVRAKGYYCYVFARGGGANAVDGIVVVVVVVVVVAAAVDVRYFRWC